MMFSCTEQLRTKLVFYPPDGSSVHLFSTFSYTGVRILQRNLAPINNLYDFSRSILPAISLSILTIANWILQGQRSVELDYKNAMPLLRKCDNNMTMNTILQ